MYRYSVPKELKICSMSRRGKKMARKQFEFRSAKGNRSRIRLLLAGSVILGLLIAIPGYSEIAQGPLSHREFNQALALVRSEMAQDIITAIPGEDILDKIPKSPWRPYARVLLGDMKSKADELLQKAAPKPEGFIQSLRDKAGHPWLEVVPGKHYIRSLRDEGIRPLQGSIANLEKLAGRRDKLLFFIQNNPITNYKILLTTRMIDGVIGDEIAIFASPGEYEAAAFVMFPAIETTVTFKISDLRSAENTIGSSELNLRLVKVWYQAGILHSETDKRILTPELLLNDDDLVRVDYEKKCNIVRNIDAPQDAAKLLPVRIPAKNPRRFWLTVLVPEDAVPGAYTGNIVVRARGIRDRKLKLKLDVLPIELPEPYLDYGIYYRGQLSAQEHTMASADWKTPRQLEADFRNMKAHGIAYPDVYQRVNVKADGTFDSKYGSRVDFSYLDKYLEIKKRSGLKIDPLYFLGVSTGSFTEESKIKERLDLIKQTLSYTRSKGIEEVFFYGSDEARGEALKRQQKMWETIHGAGGKIFVACSTGFFDIIGDLLDLPIVARHAPAELPRVHSLGRKMYNYSMPTGSIEQPYSYRYYFGHWLAQSGMDGSHTYVYQHGMGPSEFLGRIWDDFDGERYRSLAFIYPTIDGVVDTMQWEGVREAVDDIRYLTALRKAIAAVKKSGKPAAVKLAEQSEVWLLEMDIEGDLQEIRRQMIKRIVALNDKLKQ